MPTYVAPSAQKRPHVLLIFRTHPEKNFFADIGYFQSIPSCRHAYCTIHMLNKSHICNVIFYYILSAHLYNKIAVKLENERPSINAKINLFTMIGKYYFCLISLSTCIRCIMYVLDDMTDYQRFYKLQTAQNMFKILSSSDLFAVCERI